MPRSLVPSVLAAAALTACDRPPPPNPDPTDITAPAADLPTARPTVDRKTDFTDVGGGLSARLDVPPGPHELGATLEIGLELRNDTRDELRIYLVDPPIFRALQSDLAIFTSDGKFLGSQPEPHPHGYVVGETDFPAIAPGATRRFTQPLLLEPRLGESIAGDLQVRWTYRNKIESWSGGVQTLDGPTRPLFGGGRIPGIWLGELTLAAPLHVAR